MYACKSQNVEFVVELLKHVNNINTRDSDGKTVSFSNIKYQDTFPATC